MPSGGVRLGAGRKPGTPNKATAARQQEIAQSGLTPLDFMLSMMRDETQSEDNRMWAAEKAAPYVHPKLAAIEHAGKNGSDLVPIINLHGMTDEYLASVIAGSGEAPN